MSDARRPCHSASNPRAERSPSTRPSARTLGEWLARPSGSRHLGQDPSSPSDADSAHPESRPRTFSITTTFGLSSRIARVKSDHRPERVPGRIPARRPASERSWQGNPPHKMSTGSALAQSTAVTSPKFGTPGHRAASTFEGSGSNSQCQTVSPPKNASTAMSRPPTPENSEPIFSRLTNLPLASRALTPPAAVRPASAGGRGESARQRAVAPDPSARSHGMP